MYVKPTRLKNIDILTEKKRNIEKNVVWNF